MGVRSLNLAFCGDPFREQRRRQVARNHDQSSFTGKRFKQGKYHEGRLSSVLQEPDVIDEQGVKPHHGFTTGVPGSHFDRIRHFLNEIKHATIQYIETFLHRGITGRGLQQPCLPRS